MTYFIHCCNVSYIMSRGKRVDVYSETLGFMSQRSGKFAQ